MFNSNNKVIPIMQKKNRTKKYKHFKKYITLKNTQNFKKYLKLKKKHFF